MELRYGLALVALRHDPFERPSSPKTNCVSASTDGTIPRRLSFKAPAPCRAGARTSVAQGQKAPPSGCGCGCSRNTDDRREPPANATLSGPKLLERLAHAAEIENLRDVARLLRSGGRGAVDEGRLGCLGRPRQASFTKVLRRRRTIPMSSPQRWPTLASFSASRRIDWAVQGAHRAALALARRQAETGEASREAEARCAFQDRPTRTPARQHWNSRRRDGDRWVVNLSSAQTPFGRSGFGREADRQCSV